MKLSELVAWIEAHHFDDDAEIFLLSNSNFARYDFDIVEREPAFDMWGDIDEDEPDRGGADIVPIGADLR